MRQNVEFPNGGEMIRGWFYPAGDRAPAVLMAHGFSAVKEQRLDPFARAFQAAGLAVLVIDFRGLGASDGLPRGKVVPLEQLDDLRAALGWLSAHPGVDAARIGLWGTSFSGGHALFLGGLDPRVKAVVAQVPAVSVARCFERLLGGEAFAGLLGVLAAEQSGRAAGADPAMLPVVDAAGGACALPTADAAEWFLGTSAEAPGWQNALPLSSVLASIQYTPEAFINRIAPRPLLMILAERDSLIPPDLSAVAFAGAGQPKRLERWDCGHFDLYQTEPWHSRAVAAATGWFRQAL